MFSCIYSFFFLSMLCVCVCVSSLITVQIAKKVGRLWTHLTRFICDHFEITLCISCLVEYEVEKRANRFAGSQQLVRICWQWIGFNMTKSSYERMEKQKRKHFYKDFFCWIFFTQFITQKNWTKVKRKNKKWKNSGKYMVERSDMYVSQYVFLHFKFFVQCRRKSASPDLVIEWITWFIFFL